MAFILKAFIANFVPEPFLIKWWHSWILSTRSPECLWHFLLQWIQVLLQVIIKHTHLANISRSIIY